MICKRKQIMHLSRNPYRNFYYIYNLEVKRKIHSIFGLNRVIINLISYDVYKLKTIIFFIINAVFITFNNELKII